MIGEVAKVVGTCNLVGYVATAVVEKHYFTDIVSGIKCYHWRYFIRINHLWFQVGCGSFVAGAIKMTADAGGPSRLLALNSRAFFMNSLVAFWGARLGIFLFQRCLVVGEDKRLRKFFRQEGEGYLDKTRSFFPVRLSSFWMIQSLWGILCMLPVALVNQNKPISLSYSGMYSYEE